MISGSTETRGGVPIKNLRIPANQQTAARKLRNPADRAMKLRFQRKLSSFLEFLDFLEGKVSKEAKHQIEDAFVRKARWRIYNIFLYIYIYICMHAILICVYM